MIQFLQCLDRLGRLGAVRASWQKQLGDEFAECRPLLRASDMAFSIEDPDWPGQILELEEQEDGSFLGFSQEIPSHRPPLAFNREDCVRLVPNLKGIAECLGRKLGFTPAEHPQWSQSAVHEIGSFEIRPGEPLAVHLFVPNFNSREESIKSAIRDIESSILLLPTRGGFTQDMSTLAAKCDVRINVLSSAKGLDKLSIAPARKKVRGTEKKTVPPMFTPKAGWSWTDVMLSIELEGLRCRIHGDERIRPWSDMNIRLRNGRHPSKLLQILGDLGMGKRMTQRRCDVNDRKAISDVRIFLKSYVLPLNEDPFHEFEDGWGIRFTVNDKIGRRQVKIIEDEEIADSTDENSPFTYQDDIDSVEIAGFSVRQT
ncbi:MAG: hypothetical protein WCL19_00545 [Verrucomicrobiota bacterium]